MNFYIPKLCFSHDSCSPRSGLLNLNGGLRRFSDEDEARNVKERQQNSEKFEVVPTPVFETEKKAKEWKNKQLDAEDWEIEFFSADKNQKLEEYYYIRYMFPYEEFFKKIQNVKELIEKYNTFITGQNPPDKNFKDQKSNINKASSELRILFEQPKTKRILYRDFFKSLILKTIRNVKDSILNVKELIEKQNTFITGQNPLNKNLKDQKSNINKALAQLQELEKLLMNPLQL